MIVIALLQTRTLRPSPHGLRLKTLGLFSQIK